MTHTEGHHGGPGRPVCGKFVLAGNRSSVLDAMAARGLDVDVLAVRGSWLERTLHQRDAPFTVVDSRADLVSRLQTMTFDYFVANGCPWILPVSSLNGEGRTFLNIHPGPLPDLRGADPVPGALLLGRDSGAACHIMDDGIDTGPLVARVIVPNTADLDAGLLYQISFLAEQEVFNLALERAFRPAPELAAPCHGIYYSRKARDLDLDFTQSAESIVRRIRAFSNRSQGARLTFRGRTFRVFDAEPVMNPFLMARRERYAQGEVVFRYEDCLLVRLGAAFLKLKAIEGDLSVIRPGDNLKAAVPPESAVAAPAA